MKRTLPGHETVPHQLISWIFAVIFFSLGILNLIFVHPIPGIFYLFLAVFYLPFTNSILFKQLGFAIPLWIKTLAGLILLWGTLAVGDLMEIFEAWMLK